MGYLTFAQGERRPLRLYPDDRDTHMHVLGLSKQGKSFFLEHLIREDIKAGHGVCLIDPHGELYDNLVAWLVAEGLDRVKNIHLINPSDGTATVGFNPLTVDNDVPLAARVEAMVAACVRVWGGDFKETPRLAKCLAAVFYALAANKMSLAEARYLTRAKYQSEARRLVQKIDNPEYQDLWEDFLDTFSDKLFAEYFESSTSRFLQFVGNPVIRNIVGQTENVIDFKHCMDRGHIVLVNLSPKGGLTGTSAQVLGALIMNDLYATSFSRSVQVAKHRPFYFYIDEVAQFITPDIAYTLDECRKFGLHLILSHQRIWQLRNAGDDVYNAVMANAQAKVMFKAGDDETADIMCKHLLRETFDLERPKESMNKPVTVGYDLEWLEARAESKGQSVGEGESSGTSEGDASGLAQFHSDMGEAVGGHTISAGTSSALLSSSSHFSGVSSSETRAVSQAYVPRLEWLPTTLYSLEELVHLGMVMLRTLPPRTAVVSLPGQGPQRVTTLNISQSALPETLIQRAVERIYDRSAYTQRSLEALERINERAKVVMDEPWLNDKNDTGLGA